MSEQAEIAKKIVSKYATLSDYADKKFPNIKQESRRLKAAQEHLAKYGIRSAKSGKIFVAGKARPDVEILEDKNGNEYAKLKGKVSQKSKAGINVFLFPSQYNETLRASMQSWGGRGVNVPVTKDSIEVKKDHIEIEIPKIRIYVREEKAKKWLHRLSKWLESVELPAGGKAKETESEDEEEDEG